MAATLGEALKQMIAEVEAAQRGGGGGYATAEADLRQLRGMQQAWAHYAARAPRACAEAFGEAVQHDAPTLNPAVDAGFSRFLAQVRRGRAARLLASVSSTCMHECQAQGLQGGACGAQAPRPRMGSARQRAGLAVPAPPQLPTPLHPCPC